MKIINLCPHAIHIHTKFGKISIEPSGEVARCEEITKPVYLLDEAIPIVSKAYSLVTGLPDPQAGTIYLVSMLVRSTLPNRSDLLSPGDAVRDEKGVIIGCTNLVCNP